MLPYTREENNSLRGHKECRVRIGGAALIWIDMADA